MQEGAVETRHLRRVRMRPVPLFPLIMLNSHDQPETASLPRRWERLRLGAISTLPLDIPGPP